jgi:hypothetical protein
LDKQNPLTLGEDKAEDDFRENLPNRYGIRCIHHHIVHHLLHCSGELIHWGPPMSGIQTVNPLMPPLYIDLRCLVGLQIFTYLTSMTENNRIASGTPFDAKALANISNSSGDEL